ncbi:hypothetical protein GWI33_017472 [Rhynchophorus ferrugineus]|uniref:Uncharacterized protein n=1 Tax=Rhynchophorus ferrugineus TaxID=354439 RepID=A0A834M2E8_RHYFE|nr:hypothetical protein GWI33_017472 [Rhynchophorus ferrugineus]
MLFQTFNPLDSQQLKRPIQTVDPSLSQSPPRAALPRSKYRHYYGFSNLTFPISPRTGVSKAALNGGPTGTRSSVSPNPICRQICKKSIAEILNCIHSYRFASSGLMKNGYFYISRS